MALGVCNEHIGRPVDFSAIPSELSDALSFVAIDYAGGQQDALPNVP